MDVVLWVGVGICLFVIVVSAAAVTVAAVLGVKAVKTMKVELVNGVRELEASTKEMEQRLEAFSSRSDELKESLDRLSESLRKVSVLVGATKDARDIAATVSDFVPKK